MANSGRPSSIDCVTPEPGTAEAKTMAKALVYTAAEEAIATPPLHTEALHTASLVSKPFSAPITSSQAEGAAATLSEIATEDIYRELIHRLGEDSTRDGLLRTPERVARSMQFLTRGYTQTVADTLHNALFDVDYDEMVIVRDVEFYSLCEHHLLPFYGKAHIAYVPDGKVIGLSKLPRLVDVFARRLQVQERLTKQIADAVIEAIAPQGVGVILEAQHLCMMMRGVEKQHSLTTTSAMLGVFRTQVQTRNEFLSLVRRPGAGV